MTRVKMDIDNTIHSAMGRFREHMNNVKIHHLHPEEADKALEELVSMADIVQELEIMRGRVDELYPEYKELFRCLFLLRTSVEMLRKILENVRHDSTKIANLIKNSL